MSLNYDLTAIPEDVRTVAAEADGQDYKAGDRIMSPITNALIWATMGTGIGLTMCFLPRFHAKTPHKVAAVRKVEKERKVNADRIAKEAHQ
jgi:hypothetical protein